MDHLKSAKGMTDAADREFQRGNQADSGIVQANLAIAHAIIALVERIDDMTTDGLDGKQGLNVIAGLVNIDL